MSDLLENIRSHSEFTSLGKVLPLRFVEIGNEVAVQASDYVRQMGFDSPVLVVSDRNTYEVLAKHIEKQLTSAGYKVTSAIFSDLLLKPTDYAVEKVREGLRQCESCIAVGSGTINDICKYASYLEQKPYAVFATAPSMNGYASANASLIIDGHRTSKQAHMPMGVFMDVNILASAPKRLIRSGVGDMLCRSTVQSDWLLSHLLLDTPYQNLPFELVEEEESVLLESAADIVAGNREGVMALSSALIKSGLGMWLAEGSYPASQSEHMVAHVMEMAFPQDSSKSYHGEQIAVTTLAVAAIQECILEKEDAPVYRAYFDEAMLKKNLSSDICQESQSAWNKKPVSGKQQDELNQMLASRWNEWKVMIQQKQEPRHSLYEALCAAGLGLTPESIGWHAERFEWAVRVAHMTRDRFTFLDLNRK